VRDFSSRQRQHCTHASTGSADRSADRACFGFEARLLFVNKNNNKHFPSSEERKSFVVGGQIINDRNGSTML
jgi:hypothetical protein